jgi:hypothetical protein
VVGLRAVAVVVVVGRIAVVLVVAVGVVLGIHRGRRCAVAVAGRRRHRRTISIVVVAVGTWTGVVVHARTYFNDHPALVARTIPVEGERLEVFEGGEAVERVAHFVVGHDGEGVALADAVGRDVDGDSLDATGAHLDPLIGVVVAFVGVEVDVNAASVGVVANVFNVVVDGDGVGVVNHHGLRH